ITNNSWGLGHAYSQALLDAINAAGVAGQLFVTSAGNSAANLDSLPEYPAAYASPYILTVAASDASDRLAAFSNYGPTTVQVAAPGVAILSPLATSRGGGYVAASGTSMAAANAAGAALLVLGRFPGLTPVLLRNALIASADHGPG